MRILPAHVNTYVISLHLRVVYLNCTIVLLNACLEMDRIVNNAKPDSTCKIQVYPIPLSSCLINKS